ncbi:DHHC zinc finger domain containing protein [Tritrichomonas foetus]|uniref:Palmitoyltransferase n=1 Tax=Tritrichomonas foetus TaxID=1144522 RepID=A0A1J4KH41_9EUKA|nr:DHHC zinc finger domain containing protein [Tritrichomonas foetus]|eukprot:OHT09148.1 DHHC zinc finger domain containing protein [Tritrichomonas foetus]
MASSEQLDNPILDSSIQTEVNVEPTQWAVKHDCCCCGPMVEVMVPNKKSHLFLRHWEFQPAFPILVTCLTLFCLIDYFVTAAPYQYKIIQIIAPFPIFIFLGLFMWSYFGAVCMDPGYLPFNWIQTQKFYYTWQEQLSGIAVTQEQVNFAKTPKNRPPHCSFSTSAGRYVLRADHICGWIANWVGKRNHKQFMLMNLYGGLYAGCLFAFQFGVKDLHQMFDREMSILIPQVLGLALDGAFMLVLICMFFQTLSELAINRTKIQKMKNMEGGKSYSCLESMQEVCGTGNKCLWCCPTPAFDETLVMTADMPQAKAEESD